MSQKIDTLLKKLGKYGVKRGSDLPIVKRITTGVDTLDIITGGGFPAGRTTELYGEESVGKSLIAIKAIAANQKLGLQCIYIDTENALDREWAEKQGVDLSSLIIYDNIPKGEDALDFLKEVINSDIAHLIVLDSIEGIVPEKELLSSAQDAQMAVKARLMNSAVRQWTTLIGKSMLTPKPAIVAINQLRDSLSMYSPKTTPGGLGMKFFASLRIEIKGGKATKNKANETISREIKAIAQKNKLSTPYRQGYWTLYSAEDQEFPQGYCDCTSFVITEAQNLGLVEQKGAWFYYDGETYQGKSSLVDHLYDNPEIYRNFLNKIIGVTNEPTEAEVETTGEESSEES